MRAALCAMVCCLNPHCHQPINSDDAQFCHACGVLLVSKLRDRYQPVRPVGQGGFGRSYLAIDVDRLSQPCIIKQFSPQSSNIAGITGKVGGTTLQDRIPDKYEQLFEEEAQRLAELGEHPQIPALYAYFAEGGRLYLVQQFIAGDTLAQQVARLGCFSEAAVRSLLLDLLPVLQFVHSRNVIHRDIKPDNILLPEGGQKPVLIDFGVAKQLTGEALTRGGTRVGTEGYAPLEQLRSGHAYPASDLYSLAATSLFALTGCAPEDLFDPLTGRWVWRDRLQEQGRSIDPHLGQVLDRLLADRVSDRYPSAETVITALTDLAAGARSIDLTQYKWRPTITIAAHSDRICALAFSPDGHSLASAGGDRELRLWDWTTGKLHQSWSGHDGRITALLFSPDGQHLISASSDRTVRVWPLVGGPEQHCLKHHQDWVSAIALSPDGRTLASSGDDGRIVLWDWEAGQLLHSFKAHTRAIPAIAWSTDGKTLIGGCSDGLIGFWSAASGDRLHSLQQHLGRICALQTTTDGHWLISAGEDKTIKLWALDQGEPTSDKPQHVLRDSTEAVFALATNASTGLLLSGGEDHTMRVWDWTQQTLLQVLKGHGWWVNTVAIAPDGLTLASGSGDRTIQIWQPT